jgi:hypothetical protein
MGSTRGLRKAASTLTLLRAVVMAQRRELQRAPGCSEWFGVAGYDVQGWSQPSSPRRVTR